MKKRALCQGIACNKYMIKLGKDVFHRRVRFHCYFVLRCFLVPERIGMSGAFGEAQGGLALGKVLLSERCKMTMVLMPKRR